MEDDVKTLSDYVSIAWRRRFYILVPFVLALFVTFPTVMILPPVYQSTGTIAIESQQIPQELVQSTVTSFADERIEIIKRRIMTADQLFKVIEKFGLYKSETKTTPRSDILDDMRNRITIDLVSANVLNQWGGAASATIAFTVSFEHGDPGAAQNVANELVTLFLDENIKTRTARAEETTEFFRKEGERLGKQIAIMEEQIAGYKEENEGSLPENVQINLQRNARLKAALLSSEDDLRRLEESKRLVQIELDALRLEVAASGGLTADQQAQQQELRSLQNRYITLSARYGATHPDVKAIKRQIAAFEQEFGVSADIGELQKQELEIRQAIVELSERYSSEHPDVKRLIRELEGIEAMIVDAREPSNSHGDNRPSPEILQVEARLDSIDSSIGRIKNTRLDLQSQVAELDTRIARTPQVERGLDALERDYDNTLLKYEEMKAKELQAELSRSLEEEQKGERFTLLEPPLYPDHPIKPDRKKLLFLGVVLSMVSGIGVAGIAESFDGGIRGSRALATVTKMTPLAAIPYISTRRDDAIRRRNLQISIAAVIVLGVGLLAMVHFLYKPLDLVWLSVLRKLSLA
jgi:uncharacterized protein involved in exopolysaccharide biosynthesis